LSSTMIVISMVSDSFLVQYLFVDSYVQTGSYDYNVPLWWMRVWIEVILFGIFFLLLRSESESIARGQSSPMHRWSIAILSWIGGPAATIFAYLMARFILSLMGEAPGCGCS